MGELFVRILLTSLVVMDPLGAVPLFISLSAGMQEKEKRKTIVSAIVISFIVLAVFILGGRLILRFFGIMPGSFYVAGGFLFFLIAVDMLFGQPKRARTSSEEGPEGEGGSIAVFPLAIPMIAGPGMVTTIMLYSAGEYPFLPTTAMLLVAVSVSLSAMFVALSVSGFVLRVLGKTGVSVVERIMGLLLAGLSVQFIYDGLSKLGVIQAALP